MTIDLSAFDLDFRPSLDLPDNEGKAWLLDDDDELVELEERIPGTEVFERQWIQYVGEIDLATLLLQSTLSDVISLNMHRDGDTYRFRYVDEYPDNWENGGAFALPVTSADDIPTLREVIGLLDGTRFTDQGALTVDTGMVHIWGTSYGEPASREGRQKGMDFVSIQSSLYPQLPTWYEAVAAHYVETGELVYLDAAEGGPVKDMP